MPSVLAAFAVLLLHACWGPRLLHARDRRPPPWSVPGWAIPSTLAGHPAALVPSSSVADMDGLVVPKGYTLERHKVTTSDGYILVNFRILRGRHTPSPSRPGPPVLLIHGVSLCSTCWVVNQPDESLAFILADKGYDVWMMNTRGNTFSRGHKRYSTSDSQYWAFSIDEMALQDLPATIDYILRANGAYKKVALVGHSQGGSLPLMLLSRRPEYNDKVSVNIGLAPVVYVNLITSAPMAASCKAANASTEVSKLPPQEYVLLSERAQKLLTSGACQRLITVQLCVAAFDLFGSSVHIKTLQYKRYFQVWPSPTSFWNVLHWAQMYNEPRSALRAYNYGAEYDLSQVTAPTVLLGGGSDPMAPLKALDLAAQRMGSGTHGVERRQVAGYSHMDFVWDADGAKSMAYPHVLQALQQHAPIS